MGLYVGGIQKGSFRVRLRNLTWLVAGGVAEGHKKLLLLENRVRPSFKKHPKDF
jgi:hypothetical protein